MVLSPVVRKLRFRILVCILLIVTTQPLYSQQACENFGADGVALPPISNNTYFSTLAVQSDGKIVAVGYYQDANGIDMLVARYLANGTPDPAFGRLGMATFDITGQKKNDKAYCLAFTSDGRILVGGESNSYGVIIKISNNGSLYTGFSGDGKLIYNNLYSTVDAIQLSGATIHAIGRQYDVTSLVFRDLSVRAFDATGNPVTTYGDNGNYVNSDFFVESDRSFAASAQADGKLVIANTTSLSEFLENVTVTRVNANGSIDNSFGNNGIVKYEAGAEARVRDVLISGSSVYAGISKGLNSNASPLAEVIKLNENGSLATAFNNTGRSVHTVSGTDVHLNGITVNTAGVVTFVGAKKNGTMYNYLLGSYAATGTPDGAFGMKTFSIPGYAGELNDIVTLNDGSFLACGFAASAVDTLGIIWKFTDAGELQTAFNGMGYQFGYHVPTSNAYTVNVQADGKVFVGGSINIGGEFAGALVRLQPNGQPDMTFGNFGRITESALRSIDAMYTISGGGLVTAGSSDTEFVVAKYLANGTYDNGFASGGIAKIKIGADNETNDMTLDTQGNVLLAGHIRNVNQTYTEACVVRLLPNGSQDPAFGVSGAVQLPFSLRNDQLRAIALAPDNKIYGAGQGMQSLQRTGVVVRLMSDGSLDASFGTNGTVTLSGSPALEIIACEIVALPDGKIIVAYSENAYSTANDDKVFLCRYLNNGTLDTSYGTNGRFDLSFPNAKDIELRGLQRDGTGRIYISGNFVKTSTNHFFLTRLLPNGGLDTSYGTTGYYETTAYRTNAGNINTLAINTATGSLYASIYPAGEDNIMAVACIGPPSTAPDCNAMPTPTITQEDDMLVSTSGDSYLWFLNGNTLNIATQTLIPVSEGNYTVAVTTDACTKVSPPYSYTVTGILDEQNSISAYPNPVDNTIFIQTSSEPMKASVYTAQGILIHQTTLTNEVNAVNMENFPDGYYIVLLRDRDQIKSFRVLKQGK